MKFKTISTIIPSDPATWMDKIFLTFDIDWAHDQVLEDAIDLVEQAGVAATWFVTHETPLLKRLRANPEFELGLHPNFNFLLQSDYRNGSNVEEVVDRLLHIVPEAVSIRTHSLIVSSPLLAMFKKKGLTHDSSLFIPASSGLILKPFIDSLQMIRCPYVFGDYSSCMEDVGKKDSFNMLRIFNFHPIHVFLNTKSLNCYEKARPYFTDPVKLCGLKNSGNGVRRYLLGLVGGGI